MANRVVKDFEFPESFGFSGSSGKTMVRGYARGGKAKQDKVGKVRHMDKAEDVKLIRKELKKWEEKEERDEEKEDDSEEMKKGGKVKKKKKGKELPVVRVSPPLTNPNARAVPVFNSEPLVGLRRGGKAK